ncbi:hypothetical protein [Komarekiella delphini-convector]|uniref:hypothetical protein n=1 Tax=Komarekiella delphini-convector TaxID=3050158 RepID=UPI00178361E0|nr:hypothetical protein [Komarekiella delphini-convector]
MLNIKVNNLPTPNQIEEQELEQLTVAEMTKIKGGIRIQPLNDKYIDATFGGLRLTL